MSHTSELITGLRARRDSNPIRVFCGIILFAGCSVVLLSFVVDVRFISLLTAAVLCGIAETRGRCGMSHICMIAPLRAVQRGLWIRCCLAYSLGGLLTAYLIGLIIAAIGSMFNLWSSVFYLGFACLASLVLILRELGCIRFLTPQCDRQTYKGWADTFGMVTGAGMWGAHIGLGISTVITYGGVYCVLLVAFGLGIRGGEWMLIAFWMGRIVFLWVTPQLLNRTTDGMAISGAFEQSSGMFRATSVCGMVSILCVLLIASYAHLM